MQKSFGGFRTAYLEARRAHDSLVGAAKRTYYTKRINDSSNLNKTLWRIVSELTVQQHKASNMNVRFDGVMIEDPELIADKFNDFLVDIPHRLVNSIEGPSLSSGDIGAEIPIGGSSMFLRPTDEEEVLRVTLHRLKSAHSSGFDEVPAHIIKKCAHFIAAPISDIVNCSFSEGIFPDLMKSLCVSLIHKKGDTAEPSNYRPISLSSNFAKIFEYLMLQRLMDFLDAGDILDPSQHGFRGGCSTQTALCSLYEQIVDALDGGLCAMALFCDLSRAFDCVDHRILLDKMYSLGIRGLPHSWFSSYLSGREQLVEIQHFRAGEMSRHRSGSLLVDIGVPQGSVLGPILFLMYCNDLPGFVAQSGVSPVMYADDTTVLISGSDQGELQTRADGVVRGLSAWFSRNKLYINPDKTNFSIYRTRQQRNPPEVDASIGSRAIKCTASQRFLGVILDETLSFSDHCTSLMRALTGRCYQLRVLKTVLDVPLLLNIYYGQIQSLLSYGILLWGNSPHMKDVFLAQKRIVRVIVGVPPWVSCRPLFKKLRILPLASLFMLELLYYVHCHRLAFAVNASVHGYETRSRLHLHLPPRRLRLSLNAFSSLGLRLYNHIPQEYKDLQNCRRFKQDIKKCLLDGCFYSVDEFFGS